MRGPSGGPAVLPDALGGGLARETWWIGEPEGVDLTLDDEGAASWPVPLTSGAYTPADNDAVGFDSFPAPAGGSVPPQDGGAALTAFDGTNPSGVWRLYVVDDTLGSLGRFANGWSLTIKAKVRR